MYTHRYLKFPFPVYSITDEGIQQVVDELARTLRWVVRRTSNLYVKIGHTEMEPHQVVGWFKVTLIEFLYTGRKHPICHLCIA